MKQNNVAWFGPSGGFPLGDVTSNFKVIFTAAGNYSYTLEIVSDDAVLAAANYDVEAADAAPTEDQ